MWRTCSSEQREEGKKMPKDTRIYLRVCTKKNSCAFSFDGTDWEINMFASLGFHLHKWEWTVLIIGVPERDMLFSHRTVKSVLLSSSRAREMNSVLIFVNVRCRSAKCHNRKCERISCLSLTWSHCLGVALGVTLRTISHLLDIGFIIPRPSMHLSFTMLSLYIFSVKHYSYPRITTTIIRRMMAA